LEVVDRDGGAVVDAVVLVELCRQSFAQFVTQAFPENDQKQHFNKLF
jgi:hypothetical protein